MDKRILIPLIIAVLLALGGYYLTIEDKTTTTTTLQQITSTTFSPTTTRAITRPTQPTTTKVGATTLQTTTTTLSGTTTSTTIPSSSNATTASSTTTTRTDHTNPQTTTTSTTLSEATTTQAAATTTTASSTTTTILGAITTSTIQSSTTTLPGATTTSISATTTSGATTTRTTTTRITTTTTTTRTTTTTTTSTTQPALSGLVIHLKFDESAGTTAYDSSGSNDGSLVNGPTWTTGRSGNGLRLDGVNDYLDADNSASLDLTGPMTIMLWINPAAAQETCSPGAGSNRGVASKVNAASGSSTWSWQLRYGSPTNCALGFHFNDPVNGERWVTVAQALTPGQWYHVTATFDGSTVRSYLNGALKESASMSSISSQPTTKVIIGSDGWGDYFSGKVDDFRIYRRTLSATEINQIISAAGTTTTTPSTTTTTIQTTTTTTTKTTTTTTTRTTTTTTRTTTTTTRTTTTIAGGPIIGGVQIYPRDHIWNTPVDKLPLDPKSATYISSAGASANLYVYTGYYLNTADKNTPKYYLNFRYRSDAGPYSIPPNPLIETRSLDHALFVLEKDSKVFYQIFDAEKNSDGTWGTCGSGAVFDLSTYALRPDGWTSDAAGLNFLPGLLTYDEVASGEIKHALRITTWNSQNKHIWPARHDAGIADTSLPPMGQRFRLKASVDISKYTPQQQVILRAMKKYGMMLADNSGNKNIWGLSAVSDSRWDFDYTTFTGIHGSDFEAVDVSSLMIDKDSGQARQL